METESAAPAPGPALPDDVLAAVLGLLPARSLAASLCVCKAWRDLVDERRLLLRHLLPQAVRGFFVNYVDHGMPHFFARPKSSAAATATILPPVPIDGAFRYVAVPRVPYTWYKVADHCNGLVLYRDEDGGGELYVCDPATRRWARLPPLSGSLRPQHQQRRRVYLVFNPAVSRHYEVLMAPERETEPAAAAGTAEWPPSRWATWHVFSSSTGRWREEEFVREGEAAGTVADLLLMDLGSLRYSPRPPAWRYAAYWQGELYVHCHGEYVSRLSLASRKYRVIRSPIDRAECCNKDVQSFLGRSERGVHFAAIHKRRLRVWILEEHGHGDASDQWILKHDRVLKPDDWWGVVVAGSYHRIKREGPWILDDYYDGDKGAGNNDFDWSSDDDDVITTVCDHDEYPDSFHFLGFHPFKEVIFLSTLNVAMAYHWNTSKVQFLSILKPQEWNHGVYDCFVYTPCILHSL